MKSTFSIIGWKPVSEMVDALIEHQKKSAQVMMVVAQKMRNFQIKHIQSESDSSGATWPPLSEARIEQRMKRIRRAISRKVGSEAREAGFRLTSDQRFLVVGRLAETSNMPMLRDTGRLMNSLTAASDANSAVVGTNVDYAARMQFGDGDATGGVPAREYLYWDDQGVEATEMANLLSHLLVEEAFGI